MLGIDVLSSKNFDLLHGKRVGLVTNQTGVNRQGTKTRLVLHKHPQVNLVALYTPEHGLDGKEKAGKYVKTRKDSLTGRIAYSLYGETRRPTAEMMAPIDVMVYDMQDIGCRSYTYISTMIKCMEACAQTGRTFVVLDRPNPVGGVRMEGPMIEEKWRSFVGQVPVPYRHGMTAGEIAYMANNEGWLEDGVKCKLQVVRMQGWNRRMTWQDTGLRWVQTSPNIPRADSPFYYIATGIAGTVNGGRWDIGIGSPRSFKLLNGRYLDAGFRDYMKRKNPGVRFTPYGSYGVEIHVDPHGSADLTAINLHALSYVSRKTNVFARSKDTYDLIPKIFGSESLPDKIAAGADVDKLIAGWENDVARFARDRQEYLLYQ